MESEERPAGPQAPSTSAPEDPAGLTPPHPRAAHHGPRRAGRLLPLIVLLVLAACVPVGTWLLRDRGEEAPSGGVLGAETAVAPQTYPAGTAAPPLRLPALDGGTVDLTRYRGRPVLVNFWATWCAPCVREFPLLRRTLDEHRADGLVVLGVLVNDSPDKARAFVREHGGTWPVGVDRGGRAVATLKLVGLPESVFVRRDGTLSSRVLGELTPAQLQAQLAPILR
jgi:cytochrome c biogenesis protein CcmG/thiol:disulfide interchange protein DsbE